MIFSDLICPEFQTIDLQELGLFSTQSLYTPPLKLFETAYSKLTIDAPRKRRKTENTYRQFVKELSGTKRMTHFLKYASNEWTKLVPERKNYYKEKATISNSSSIKRCEETRKIGGKLKKIRRACSSITFFISCKHKISKKSNFIQLSKEWKNLSADAKEPFKNLEILDRERYEFEKTAVSRFEFILRLLRASEPKLLPKTNKRVYDVFKEHYIETLKESGWVNIANTENIARFNYKKLSEEDRKQYKQLRKTKKKEENFDLFLKVLSKSYVNFRNLPLDNDKKEIQIETNFFGEEEDYEEDFEDFFANIDY
ncbi:unnamed protein product [Blepharisma stoltei]|uniref:HMG box domain-containing protein n=1 Tax=Blepharisma stoltei TaxID=1481888 RepID=A0AAU9JEM1_9CILI|nr:unnamed protein product [Blepharisma stoltei]